MRQAIQGLGWAGAERGMALPGIAHDARTATCACARKDSISKQFRCFDGICYTKCDAEASRVGSVYNSVPAAAGSACASSTDL
jgi:hypothetical protein